MCDRHDAPDGDPQVSPQPTRRNHVSSLKARIEGLRSQLKLEEQTAGRMALVVFAVRVGGAALAYISQILMARWMGAHDYGVFSVVWTLAMLLSLTACIGFSSSPNRFIPQYAETQSPGFLRGYLRASQLLVFVVGTGIALIAATILWQISPHLDPSYVLPAWIILLSIPVYALTGVQEAIARSYDWPLVALLPTYIWRPLAIPLLLALVMVTGSVITAHTAAWAAVAATWGVALYQLAILTPRLNRIVPPAARQYDMPLWLSVSLPMLLVEGSLQLITSADVIMVSFWCSPHDVGIYYAASKSLALVHFVYFAVRAASAHRFAALVARDDTERLSHHAQRMAAWTFWPSLAAAIVLLLIAPLLLRLFGTAFTAGYPVIAILVIGVLARSAIGPTESLLSMSGHQKSCALIYTGAFILNVVVNFLLIPTFGLMGAAAATSLAILLETACLLFVAHRQMGIWPIFISRKLISEG